MRKHPILLGLILLFAIGFFSFLFLFGISLFDWSKGSFTSGRDKIGVVPVKGPILDSKDIVDQINKCADDPGIAAILLRIDSPGGGVAASQEIYDSVLSAK